MLSLLAFALPCTAGQAQEQLSGCWRGFWYRAGDSMLVTLDVQRDAGSGRYRATFGSDRVRVSGIPLDDVQPQACCDVTMTLGGDRTTTAVDLVNGRK